MQSSVTKEFVQDDTWTCPAGIKNITVKALGLIQNQVASAANSAVVDVNSDLYTFGANTNGQLGLGDVTPRSSPVIVLGGFKWRQVATTDGSGVAAVVGITAAGDGYSCGANSRGQLGLGDVTVRSSPVLVLGGFKWRQISVGPSYCLGIDSTGSAYGWGLNSNGQLGLGDVTPRSSPVIVLESKTWTQLSGGTSALGISAGQAFGWGINESGQLGNGDTTPRSSPVLVLGGFTWRQIASAIATGAGYSLGVDINGDAYGWGNNVSGQLGLGDVTKRSSPIIVLGGFKWRQVVAGLSSSYGITTAGDLYAWGNNDFGQLGLGDVASRSSPVIVLGGFKWTRITAQTSSVLGVTTTGDAYAWGFNNNGGSGTGNVTAHSSPVLVLGGFKYQAVKEVLLNQIDFQVVPGTTYAITVYGAVSMFNYAGLYQDPYGSGAIPTRVVLEYYT